MLNDRYYGVGAVLVDWKGDQELFYRELKVDLRSRPCLQSHTPLTAMQEIAALILAYAVLVDYRVEAAAVGEVAGTADQLPFASAWFTSLKPDSRAAWPAGPTGRS